MCTDRLLQHGQNRKILWGYAPWLTKERLAMRRRQESRTTRAALNQFGQGTASLLLPRREGVGGYVQEFPCLDS